MATPMSDTDRVELVLSVMPWLAERGPLRLSDIAANFGVDPLRLYADLKAVSTGPEPAVGFYCYVDIVGVDDPDDADDDLWDDDAASAWDTTDPADDPLLEAKVSGYYEEPPRLGLAEALGLFVAAVAYRDMPGYSALRSAQDKLAQAVAQSAGAATADVTPEALAAAVVIDLGDATEGTLATVSEALDRRRRIHLRYYSAGRDDLTERDVDPWRLRSRRGSWYLTGHDDDAGVRHFRLDRVLAVEVLDEDLRLPAPEDVPEPLDAMAEGGRPVEIRVPVGLEWMVDDVPSEEARTTRAGHLVVTCRVHGDAWLDRLMLSLGPDAEVTGADGDDWPARRREDAARRMLARHGAVPQG